MGAVKFSSSKYDIGNFDIRLHINVYFLFSKRHKKGDEIKQTPFILRFAQYYLYSLYQ